jgi:putative endopeptidase
MRYSLFFAFLALAAGLAAQPVTQLPYSPSLDLTSMDTTVQPCEDFYRYSCGNWSKKNPIPADQASWDVYGKLAYDNERLLWGILDQAAKGGAGRGDSERKIGDYFQACMDESAVEKAGLQPIEPALKRIAAIRSLADLSKAVTAGHADGTGSGTLFSISSDQDLENSQSVIAFANRGALGLPDRDYYTKTDAKSVEIRKKYVAHMASVFTLLGDSPNVSASEAKQVMAIETELASSMLTRVELRDPHRLLHKMDRKQFQALAPSFAWDGFFPALGLESAQTMNVTEPAFYQALEKSLRAHKLDAWRAFLRWNLIRDASPYLSSAFVKSSFDFYSKYLRGVPEQQPRWRRCVRWTDRDLGEVLGQVFVAKTFTPETKARTVAMTKEIELAMENDLKQLPWMGDATRKRALEKLHSIVNKIGYPDKWRDYSALTISAGDFGGNVLRASQFEDRRQLAKIGKPLDRTEWGMTPPTVNAYYNPQMNDINFPAGVLQPPLFDPKLDESPNYGNTGSTIGHELTHGFDDEGRQFDAKGNLAEWWTKSDGEQFQARAEFMVKQFDAYEPLPGLHINGKASLGENIADLGGLLLGIDAFKKTEQYKKGELIGGLTPMQRYFLGYTLGWMVQQREEVLRRNLLSDVHAPAKWRVLGPLSNLPEFHEAFNVKEGQAMWRKESDRVHIW